MIYRNPSLPFLNDKHLLAVYTEPVIINYIVLITSQSYQYPDDLSVLLLDLLDRPR